MYDIEYSHRTDLDEILSDESSYVALCDVFGDRKAERQVYDEIHYRSFESEDDVIYYYNDSYDDILVALTHEKPITDEDLECLGISRDHAMKIGCSIVTTMMTKDGVEVEAKFVEEDPRQLTLFPELEIGLPPYKYLVPIDITYFLLEKEKKQ